MSKAPDGDWRLTVRVRSHHHRSLMLRALSERSTAAVAEDHVKELVSVRRDGPWLRLYTSSYEALAQAQDAIYRALSELDASAEERPERFDADIGQWAAVDAPLVSEMQSDRVKINPGRSGWGSAAEKDRLTIHLEFAHRSDALTAAERLISDGYDAYRHWTTVYLFADDRPGADALVEELSDDLRDRAQVFVMGDGPQTFFI